jgi:hypothetical protein
MAGRVRVGGEMAEGRPQGLPLRWRRDHVLKVDGLFGKDTPQAPALHPQRCRRPPIAATWRTNFSQTLVILRKGGVLPHE